MLDAESIQLLNKPASIITIPAAFHLGGRLARSQSGHHEGRRIVQASLSPGVSDPPQHLGRLALLGQPPGCYRFYPKIDQGITA